MKARLRQDLIEGGDMPPLLNDRGRVVGMLAAEYMRIDWTKEWDCIQYEPNAQNYTEFNLVIYNEDFGLFFACNIDFEFIKS